MTRTDSPPFFESFWARLHSGGARRSPLVALAPLLLLSGVAQSASNMPPDKVLSVPSWVARDANEVPELLIITKNISAAQALAEIRAALPAISNLSVKAKLLDQVGRFIQTKEAADLLTEFLQDPTEDMRRCAIHGLRLMAARFHRGGVQIKVAPPDPSPQVDGLVPTLIIAAKDSSPRIRQQVAYALADARDDQATRQLRELLRDKDSGVRFNAAYLLTEFNDASGLAELKARLDQLNKMDRAKFDFGSAEMVFAALERITSRNFGEIPMIPWLSSDASQHPILQKRYFDLLTAWSDFIRKSPAALR